ncbi:alpha/beta hydrolase [Nocardia uniformis]|uniref:alpha/beta hydrolase n=1 Tax=Nocardia uniformis TaxID=53432 RepID=UPI003530FF7C
MTNQTLVGVLGALPPTPDVSTTTFTATADDGTTIPSRWYARADSAPGSAVVYVHGGGMICGSVELYEPLVQHYVQLTGVPMLSVDYRLAPEVHDSTPATDSFAALQLLYKEADNLGVDRSRIALMGDSGGGGIAASTAILARDNGIEVAKQILVYPMLDDRNTEPDPILAPTALWSYDNNYTAWHALLGDTIGGATVSPLAAAARLVDFSNLAPAYIEVGELDIFRDESLRYAQQLATAGVSCEFHLYPGAPHGYDWLGVQTAIGTRVMTDRIRVLKSL